MHSCTFYWQEEMGKIDARSRRRVGRYREVNARPCTPRRRQLFGRRIISRSDNPGAAARGLCAELSTSMNSISIAPGWPAECMRRDRGSGAPHVDRRREEFFGSAVAVAQVQRGQRQAQFDWTRLQLYAADRWAFHQPGLRTPCQVFLKGVFLKGVFPNCAARPRPEIRDHDRGRAGATAAASVSAGLSWSTALAVSRGGQGDADATTRNNREGAMPPASNAADRTSGVNVGAAAARRYRA
jgi:hypothetical protein